MAALVALLRAVNVGGNTALPMERLRAVCEAAGFEKVRTYIQSGNVVFTTSLTPDAAREKLEAALAEDSGTSIGVLVRDVAAIRQIVSDDPFREEPGSKVGVFFLSHAPDAAEMAKVVAPGGECVIAHGPELYVHYPNGMGRSKLKLPAARDGTMRNMNTVKKLAAMLEELA